MDCVWCNLLQCWSQYVELVWESLFGNLVNTSCRQKGLHVLGVSQLTSVMANQLVLFPLRPKEQIVAANQNLERGCWMMMGISFC